MGKKAQILRLLIAAGVALSGELAAAESLAGRWSGVVSLGAGETEITVVFTPTDTGLRGALSAPGLDRQDLELADLEISGRTIAFTVADLGNGVRLSGELDAAGSSIRGESVEGPAPAPPATDVYLFDFDGPAATRRRSAANSPRTPSFARSPSRVRPPSASSSCARPPAR